MEPEQIKWNDWSRIFLGDAPPEFFLELVFRTVVVFFLLIISFRLMGKRMSAQLTRIETTALFVMAAAIGVPLPSPDRGLLPPILIAVVVILVGRLVARLAFKDPRFERRVVDDYATLVKDGVMLMDEMKKTRISVERLLSYLREKSIMHLGQVERVYFEANGSLSLMMSKNPRPGLSVIPPEDEEFYKEQQRTDQELCCKCGDVRVKEEKGEKICLNCGEKERTTAVL